jgi:hypothetical protein
MARDEALRNKQLTYFTGKPCRHGHIAERRTSNYQCIQCAKEIHYVTDRDNYRYGNTLLRQFNTRKQQAKNKGIPFTVTYEEIEKPEYCPVFGIKLNYGWSGVGGPSDHTKASFDKVIPALGYVPGNVFIISWRANKLKNNMSIEELEQILKYMKERI